MSHSNWAFLFLGRDVLETIFNTSSKKKKLLKEREKENQKREKMQIYCHFSGS